MRRIRPNPARLRPRELRRDFEDTNARWVETAAALSRVLEERHSQQYLRVLFAQKQAGKRPDRVALRRAAREFLAVLDLYPDVGNEPIGRAGVPIFPRQQGYNRAMGPIVGAFLAASAVTFGLVGQDPDRFFARIWGIVSGPDLLNTLFRNVLTGRPFDPDPPARPATLVDRLNDLERCACTARVWRALTRFGDAVYRWRATSHADGITGLTPTEGRAGATVVVHGNGFGRQQPRGTTVYFPVGYSCAPAEILAWTDTGITVRAPAGVSVGRVGFGAQASGCDRTVAEAARSLASEIASRLGPLAGSTARNTLSKVTTAGADMPCPPCLPGNVNRFWGGSPSIRSFLARVSGGPLATVRSTGAMVELSHGDSLELMWHVDRATRVEIAARGLDGQLHELPAVAGPINPRQGTLSVRLPQDNPVLSVSFVWDGVYELTASNDCGSTTTHVIIQARNPQAAPSPWPSFFWGVGTAGRQVEGGIVNDDWEIMTTAPVAQRIMDCAAITQQDWNPRSAGLALNHWNIADFAASVDRARALGANAYRLSIEWSRIAPSRGRFDRVALGRYRAMIDLIRARRLEPIVVLCHLSLPAWVLTPPRQCTMIGGAYPSGDAADRDYSASLGGWESQDTVDEFVAYVDFVARAMPTVTWWITFNEPLATTVPVGYMSGVFPPGFTAEAGRARKAIHNIINAHVRAFDTIRAATASARIGITDQWIFCKPDLDADATDQFVYYHQDYLINALVAGTEDAAISVNAPVNQRVMGVPASQWTKRLDFFGLQYYKSGYPEPRPGADFLGAKVELKLTKPGYRHALLNDMGWEICPAGLHAAIMKCHRISSGLPILVAENGIAEIVDRNRSAYITSHLREIERAIGEGANVIGYLHWTIADNWEWIDSYRPAARFGLFSVQSLGAVPATTDMPHAITDGALALAYATHAAPASITTARDCFGRYRPDGSQVEHPTTSPFSTWEGSLDTEPVTLLAGAAGGAAAGGVQVNLLGLLFYHVARRWIRLESVAWDPVSRTLQAWHGAIVTAPAVRERVMVASLDPSGSVLGGRVTEHLGNTCVTRDWRLIKQPLAGMWQTPSGTGRAITLSLTRTEGHWIGRVLDGLEWTTLRSVVPAPSGLSALRGLRTVTLNALMPPATNVSVPTIEMVEQLPRDAGISATCLTRLPDNVPF